MGEQTKEGAAWTQNAWRLRLTLEVSSLDPPAVQYAIFAEDPVPRFAVELERVRELCQRQISDIHEPERRQTARQVQLIGVWERLFRLVRGDEVSLAVSGKSDLVLLSNAPAGRRWIVTKTVQFHGRRCCWSVPFVAEPGQEMSVLLSEENALELATLDRSPLG